jgi:hypothetical protein
LQLKINELQKKAIKTLELTDKLERINFENLGLFYKQLLSLSAVFTAKKHSIFVKIDDFDDLFQNKLADIFKNGNINIKDMKVVAQSLIALQRFKTYSPVFSAKVSKQFDALLTNFKDENDGINGICKLSILLQKDYEGIGSSIVSEHPYFKGARNSIFATKTSQFDIDYVLDNMKINGNLESTNGFWDFLFLHKNPKEKLKSKYEAFRKKYDVLIEKCLTQSFKVSLNEITELVKNEIKKIPEQDKENIVWNQDLMDRVPNLTAYIFVLWTLQNSADFFEATSMNDRRSYLMQPHPAQVIAIFRTLCIDGSKPDLVNNLAEILTGEGKSIQLAVTAIILALYGFDVSVASYSNYLSTRDKKDFEELFALLKVETYIRYGTFNELCEYAINDKIDIRDAVSSFVLTNQIVTDKKAENTNAKRKHHILLFDEVDVFFSKDFFGQLYTPSAAIQQPSFIRLVEYIWLAHQSKTNNDLSLSDIKNSQQYNDCLLEFKDWNDLLDESVKAMLADVETFDSHQYVVLNDKIGYTEHGEVNFRMSYGYKTMFAYWHEHTKDSTKVSRSSVDQHTYLAVEITSFSYSEIPFLFSRILGVTGTLEALSESKKKVVSDTYNIKRHTYIPSVYGASKRKFRKEKHTHVEPESNYCNRIEEEIKVRLSNSMRTVLVFFETEKRMMECYLKTTEVIKEKIQIYTEAMSTVEKNTGRQMLHGQVKFFPKFYGRGFDFYSDDPILEENGGAHALITFFPDNEADFKQLLGRIARQGSSGSISLVLLDSDLEKYDVYEKEIKENFDKGILHQHLCFKRNLYETFLFDIDKKLIEQSKIEHLDSVNFMKNLINKKNKEVHDYLLAKNKVDSNSSNKKVSRIIFMMDGTGSMGKLVYTTSKTIGNVVAEAKQTLKEKKVNDDKFEVQFVVYRNYNSPINEILQFSPWESSASNLQKFIDTVKPAGGWGEEALEVALHHANLEAEKVDSGISLIVLLGDMPPNSKTDVDNKRRGKVFDSTPFSIPTFYKDEVEKLKQKNIKIHSYYLYSAAKVTFDEIASATGGKSEFFGVESSQALIDLLTTEILGNIGGEELVNAYYARKTYASI